MAKKDVTHKKVTMRSVALDSKGDTMTHEAVDPHVPVEFVDAYVADAQTRWQAVTVEDSTGEPKQGTHHPEHLKAGKTLQQHLHDTGVKDISDPSNAASNLFGK